MIFRFDDFGCGIKKNLKVYFEDDPLVTHTIQMGADEITRFINEIEIENARTENLLKDIRATGRGSDIMVHDDIISRLDRIEKLLTCRQIISGNVIVRAPEEESAIELLIDDAAYKYQPPSIIKKLKLPEDCSCGPME